jgi:hypothetical protein
MEEGTVIPLEIKEQMMGHEIVFLPNGYFNAAASEGLF